MALLLPPRLAIADGPNAEALAESKRHFRRAETAFALGRFAEAGKAYQAAYKAANLPKLLLNIGQCHRNLGDYDKALFSFRKYLELVPDAPNRTQIRSYISEIEREQAASAAAQRALTVRPPPLTKAARPALYKRWWFIAGVSAIASAAVTAVTITQWPGDPCPPESCLDFDR